MPMRFMRSPLVLVPLVLALVLAAYWPGLSGSFLFDDFATIVENPRVHASTIDVDALSRAATSFDPGGLGRQLPMASFAVDHALGGLEPFGYKLHGLIVHLLNTLLVYFLCARIFALAGVASRNLAPVAAGAALLWAAHPLQVSSVLYVVQRMETMSLTFVLLALLAYLLGRTAQIEGRRGWPWLAGCAPLLLLSLACKETGVLFPLYALVLECTLLGFKAHAARTARVWRLVYAGGCAFAAIVYVAVVLPHYASADQYFARDYDATQRVLTQMRVLPMYLCQILIPLPDLQTFHYDQVVASTGWLSPPTTLLGALLLAALFVTALVLRRRMPLFALGILWFFAAHFLTSNVVPLELVFEHRNYFAILGIVLAVTDLARRIPMRQGPGFVQVASACVIAAFIGLTVLQSSVWGDRFLLATVLSERNPASARASSDLAAIYLEMTDGSPNSPFNDFAMREFERASLQPGASIVADQGLILAAAQAGREIDDIWWQRLIGKLETQTIKPETTGAMFGLLGNRLKGFKLDDHRLTEAFLALFSRVTMSAVSYAQFGDYVLRFVGDQDLADRMFVIAVEQSVANPGYVDQMRDTLETEGHVRQANVVAARAKELGIQLDASSDSSPVPHNGG